MTDGSRSTFLYVSRPTNCFTRASSEWQVVRNMMQYIWLVSSGDVDRSENSGKGATAVEEMIIPLRWHRSLNSFDCVHKEVAAPVSRSAWCPSAFNFLVCFSANCFTRASSERQMVRNMMQYRWLVSSRDVDRSENSGEGATAVEELIIPLRWHRSLNSFD